MYGHQLQTHPQMRGENESEWKILNFITLREQEQQNYTLINFQHDWIS